MDFTHYGYSNFVTQIHFVTKINCRVSFANFDGSTTHPYALRFVAVSFLAVSFAIPAGVVTWNFVVGFVGFVRQF